MPKRDERQIIFFESSKGAQRKFIEYGKNMIENSPIFDLLIPSDASQ
ncbi:hypothetical protein OTSSIDO_0021, partial [Orientia tsutsugamushi str. Sido]